MGYTFGDTEGCDGIQRPEAARHQLVVSVIGLLHAEDGSIVLHRSLGAMRQCMMKVCFTTLMLYLMNLISHLPFAMKEGSHGSPAVSQPAT